MKTAIVLFNLGGPDRQESVRPFLFNLFNDKAIIGLPGIFRTPLAYLIAKRRAKKAQEIYQNIGGGSPLLPNTEAQAKALETALGSDFNVFTCMRYWHPMSFEVAHIVKDYNPDRILLLPLYPQFSTTTTASSVKEWDRAAKAAGLNAPTQTLCCYPDQPDFIAAQADLIREKTNESAAFGRPRLLFSAHGLPKKIVAAGDPYQWQCEQTAKALVAALGDTTIDWLNCYQSRVGPLEWIGPSTDDEIKRAGETKTPIIIVPIAFVSEHSETLVELDIEYAELAHEHGVPFYGRVSTVGTHPNFIAGLVKVVQETLQKPHKICSFKEKRLCPSNHTKCPLAA